MEQLWCGWLVGPHKAKTLVNVHHLQMIDLEETRPPTWRGCVEKWQIRYGEKKVLRRLQHVRSCSPRLTSRMKAINPKLQVTVVPVGIDPGQYDYIPDDKRTTEPLVSVIGTMTWYPTISAAKRLMTRLWPEIKSRIPKAKVQLVGWGAKTALAEFAGDPDITIAENVPDIRPYFERTGVMLYAPGRGSGMKIKILESLGFGVPVVTTSEGSEGMPAIDGVHLGLCEDDAGLIDRAVKLLSDPALQNRYRAAGRKLLEEHCGPKPTVDAIERIYEAMLHGDHGQ
jgi:glycosyltransferase involved in cell wall biosynthesis